MLPATGESGYKGRFAPSPTGPLHQGSLVAALASWLDARAVGGSWIVRMEDVDTPRCVSGSAQRILEQLAACGLVSDEPVVYQSERGDLYQSALDNLIATKSVYPCGCSRRDIELRLSEQGSRTERFQAAIYPGTCHPEHGGLKGKSARAWRFSVPRTSEVAWRDRAQGAQHQNVTQTVGDFVLKRADGLWAYQLAVVVDDAAQGITHVVRGLDLLDNTPRQILLQRALNAPTPQYLHAPLVLGDNGEKLSKQNGAQALDTSNPCALLDIAAKRLQLPAAVGTVGERLASWAAAWTGSPLASEIRPAV